MGPIGSAVLAFIVYKRRDRQAKFIYRCIIFFFSPDIYWNKIYKRVLHLSYRIDNLYSLGLYPVYPVDPVYPGMCNRYGGQGFCTFCCDLLELLINWLKENKHQLLKKPGLCILSDFCLQYLLSIYIKNNLCLLVRPIITQ